MSVAPALAFCALATLSVASPARAQDDRVVSPASVDDRFAPASSPENSRTRIEASTQSDDSQLDPPLDGSENETETQTETQTESVTETQTPGLADPRTNLTIHPDAGSITYQQWMINVTSESQPNAVPVSAPAYGDPSGNCTYSQSTLSLLPCYNPLRIIFDVALPANFTISNSSASPSSIPIASLAGTGPSNLLTLTNSIGSTDGGVQSIVVTGYCSGTTLNVTVTVTNEDSSVFRFTSGTAFVSPCTFSGSISGSLSSSTTSDTGNFTMTMQYLISGTFKGNFNENQTSFNTTGNSTLTTVVNSDFTASGTVSVAAGQICSAQTSVLSLSSAGALAQANGVQPPYVGISVGDTLELAASDSTTLIWFVASDENYIGNTLPSGYIFVTGYVVSGVCAGTYFYDAPFRTNIGRTRGPLPVRHRPLLVHPQMRLAFRP